MQVYIPFNRIYDAALALIEIALSESEVKEDLCDCKLLRKSLLCYYIYECLSFC